MTFSKLVRAVAVATAVCGFDVVVSADAHAQVWFFSRSGKSSYFAAGVHGYGETPDSNPRRAVVVGNSAEQTPPRRPVWRETSVYEAYPPAVLRRGGGYHVLPGGYRYESLGGWE